MRSAHDVFRGLRARARTGILIEGFACVAAALAVFVLVSYGVDRWLHLEQVFRAVLLLLLVVGLHRVATRRLRRPLAVELGDDELALAVERTEPGIKQALISAVEFERALDAGRMRGQSETMMRSVVDDAGRRLAQLDFVRALDARRVVRFGALLGAATLGTIAFLIAVPDAGLWLRRNLLLSGEAWPRKTVLAFDGVTTGTPLRIAEREDLTLRVRATGVVPDDVELVARFATGETALRAMDRTGEELFTTTLPSLLEDVTLVARGGDGETDPIEVRIVPRPRVTGIAVTLIPPEYVGTEPRPLAEIGGELLVPRGGRLEIVAECSKPLRQAALVLGDDQRIAATLATAGRAFHAAWTPEASGPVRLDLTDEDDLGPVTAPQMLVRVVDDLPPKLDYVSRGVGSMITANAKLPGTLKLRDDFGLGAVTAVYRTMEATPPDDGAPAPEPEFVDAPMDWATALEVGSTEQSLDVTFDLLPRMVEPDPDSERNPIHPGLLLSVRFDATDRRAPDPQTGSSEIRTFRVVTTEKLLQELRRRQGEQRRELERVRDKVKEARSEVAEIVSPTGDDPNASKARLRVQALARQQSALGKTVQGIADRYAAILEELVNNRLFEPNVVQGIEAMVVSPLVTLALDAFPASSGLAAAFAETGTSAARFSTVEAYDDILATIERVLDQMVRSESRSEIAEALRVVIRIERETQSLVETLRDQEGSGIFGPGSGRETPPKKDDKD